VPAAVRGAQVAGHAVPGAVGVAAQGADTRSSRQPATVQKQLDDQSSSRSRTRTDFDTFLKRIREMTMNDLLFPREDDVLTQQVRQKIVAGRDKVSDAAIASYYAKEHVPLRPARAGVTSRWCDQDQGKADQARPRSTAHRLEQGREEVPIDQASRRRAASSRAWQGSAGEGVRQRDLQRRQGKVIAPVKTQFATTCSRVDSISKARSRPAAKRTTRTSTSSARSRSRMR